MNNGVAAAQLCSKGLGCCPTSGFAEFVNRALFTLLAKE